jgi:hypothetical protein
MEGHLPKKELDETEYHSPVYSLPTTSGIIPKITNTFVQAIKPQDNFKNYWTALMKCQSSRTFEQLDKDIMTQKNNINFGLQANDFVSFSPVNDIGNKPKNFNTNTNKKNNRI